MNEKLSFQNIADTLAQKAGVQKRVAETFSKAFFDTIVEAMGAGESIKIKGLGTFKLVEVGDRESVNVSTGMRFVIPGYKKVAFTAEDSVVEVLSGHTESEASTESTEKTETADLAETAENVSVVSAKEETIEELIQVPEPTHVEQPQDKFAGIDMLISTPESVDDIRQQYEAAKAKMDAAVEEARKANAEKLRLERLLDRLEKNVEPEETQTESTEIEKSADTAEDVSVSDKNDSVSDEEESVSDEVKRQEAFNRVMVEQPKPQEPEPQSKKSNGRSTWLTLIIILLVTVLGVFVYLIYRNIEAVEQVPTTAQNTQTAKPSKPSQTAQSAAKPVAQKVDKDSLARVQKADSIKALKVDSIKTQKAEQPSKPESSKTKEDEKLERPKTHRMQRGESLTRISQKYYGTKDSVRAILRVNTFANPDNIPVGAVVKLP